MTKQEAKRLVVKSLKDRGVVETARLLDVARETVLRFTSGADVRRGTELLILQNATKLSA